jgi:hypothetical protein
MLRKFVFAVSVLLIILFCYATIAKTYDMTIFRSQMMQSPLLPASLVNFLSFAVPAVELSAVLLLIFNKTRLAGMYLSYSIMFGFSLYLIMLVWLFKGAVPCACGGILGRMGYTAHIFFNIFFTILPLISIFILGKESNKNKIAFAKT